MTGAVSVAAALAVVAGLLQFASGPAVAADGADMPSVTLTGPHRAAPRQAFMTAADGTGYLSVPRRGPSGYPAVWTGRDGSTRVLPRGWYTYNNGGFGREEVPNTTNIIQIRHFATGKVTRFYLRAGDRATRVFAENRLLVARKVDEKWTLRLLEMPAGGGQPADRPVTGVEDTFNGDLYDDTSDARGASFTYWSGAVGTPSRTVLLDFDTAAVTYVPRDGFGALGDPHLAGDKVLFHAYDKDRQSAGVYSIDRSRPEVPGHLVDVPRDVRYKARAIGDWVLYPDTRQNTIRAVSVTGGPERTLLTASTGTFVDGGDGSLSIEGGTDAEHWAVQRVTLGADGAPAVEPLVPLPPVSVYEAGGVVVDQGQLLLGTERAAASVPDDGTDLTSSALSLAADGTLTASPPERVNALDYYTGWDSEHGPYQVYCYEECLRLTGNGEGSISYPWNEEPPAVAASGPYRVIRKQDTLQVRLQGWENKVLATGSWSAAALWGNTLWTAKTDATNSDRTLLERFSLPSMRRLGSESQWLGGCPLSDLQVVGRYVYWSCGPDTEAGVIDQQSGDRQTVPKGYAQLADGYLVSQDDEADKLLITYLRGAAPDGWSGTEELGPLPSSPYPPADRRGRFWNVDRFGGPVAYQTASGDVTVKWPQVTTSPLAAIDAPDPASADLRKGNGFQGVWHLNRPAESWKLTVTTSTGAAVRTITGGLARGKLTATWDGRDENGVVAHTGTYRMKLTARAVKGTTDTLLYDKQVPVRSVERHDFGQDGIGDLITFDSAGRVAVQPGSGRGTIDTAHKALGGGWPTSSTFVPFGNLSGKWCNDLLVRDSAGRLTRYDARYGSWFSPRTPHRLIGTGFGGYNVLTSPGDLTGDGRADLIARDKAGVLWRYSDDGKGGLAARVRLVAGQGGYTRLVGAGDLNGDHIGDMVGLDRAGVLWRWLGNGRGAFGSRVRIAGGINVNALVVPGDLTGDGRPDLLGRDRAGALWRWNGTASATFGRKTRIATGWQGYKALY
ncbi:FlgD immunoglobulin-like domain containing protein [Streptomyces sp. NBC_00576]|uniref:FlgD immunoglobulin-like domain containing protein n=1 Tax=Streptomyces sp. NBC_00576 TaxID=2903665 RepID=UPI002E806597|nr:FG-GAP-like repeat-containing protein [Streptomyces sp. NBC_00576]WUB72902.1 hypothetical protein OG734_23905 [Streptomyces sp. NBC_00576]